MRENMVDAVVKSLQDAQSVACSVAGLEREMDADKFVKTATAVQKLSASRDVKTVHEWVEAAGIQLNPVVSALTSTNLYSVYHDSLGLQFYQVLSHSMNSNFISNSNSVYSSINCIRNSIRSFWFYQVLSVLS